MNPPTNFLNPQALNQPPQSSQQYDPRNAQDTQYLELVMQAPVVLDREVPDDTLDDGQGNWIIFNEPTPSRDNWVKDANHNRKVHWRPTVALKPNLSVAPFSASLDLKETLQKLYRDPSKVFRKLTFGLDAARITRVVPDTLVPGWFPISGYTFGLKKWDVSTLLDQNLNSIRWVRPIGEFALPQEPQDGPTTRWNPSDDTNNPLVGLGLRDGNQVDPASIDLTSVTLQDPSADLSIVPLQSTLAQLITPKRGFTEDIREPLGVSVKPLNELMGSRYFIMLPEDTAFGLANLAQVSVVDPFYFPEQLQVEVGIPNFEDLNDLSLSHPNSAHGGVQLKDNFLMTYDGVDWHPFVLPFSSTSNQAGDHYIWYNMGHFNVPAVGRKPRYACQHIRSIYLRFYLQGTFEPKESPFLTAAVLLGMIQQAWPTLTKQQQEDEQQSGGLQIGP